MFLTSCSIETKYHCTAFKRPREIRPLKNDLHEYKFIGVASKNILIDFYQITTSPAFILLIKLAKCSPSYISLYFNIVPKQRFV